MIWYIKSGRCLKFDDTCHQEDHYKLQRAISGVRCFS